MITPFFQRQLDSQQPSGFRAHSKALAFYFLFVGLATPHLTLGASDTKKAKPSVTTQKAHKEVPRGAQDEKGFVSLLGENAKEQWRGYANKAWPKGWKLEDGVLARVSGGGDLMTSEQYENFELRLDWKISPNGNSGILYRVTTGDKQPYDSGLEYQVYDEGKRAKNMLTTASALYGLYAPNEVVASPVGEWNTARIVSLGNHVEHWLNGKKVAEFEIGSDDWNQRLAKSKFIDWPKFAKSPKGYISLQDHQSPVWYRNVRIKRLDDKQ